jgi:hypothetical protein
MSSSTGGGFSRKNNKKQSVEEWGSSNSSACTRPTRLDTLVGSAVPNLKELRTSSGGALRVLFVFDPLRTAILLLGGDKTGKWKQWYEEAIPQAERLYEEHLSELRAEGVISDDKA